MAQFYIQVENAKTDRSRCRRCREFIEEGAVRMAMCLESEGKVSRPWHHPQCIELRAQYKTIELKDILGYDTLKSDEDRQLTQTLFEKAKNPPKKAKKSKKRQSNELGVNQTDTSSHDISSIIPFRKPRQGNQGYSQNQFTEFITLFEHYMELPAETLRQQLQINNQPKNGSKKELAEKCADGRLLGQIQFCPECGGGRLRYNRNTGYYTCPGFMDDQDFRKCGRKFDKTEIARPPWQTPSKL